MRKILLLAVAALCMLVYCVCSSDALIKKIAVFKYGSASLLASDKYRYGDLYGMSYVPWVKVPRHEYAVHLQDRGTEHIDLYTVCDSYIWDFIEDKQAFYGVRSYTMCRTNAQERLAVKLDSTKKSVLLVEFAERNLGLLYDTAYMYSLATPQVPGVDTTTVLRPAGDNNKLERALFNPDINTNIEFLLWDTRLFTGIKEAKGSLSALISQKVNTDVTLSDDRSFLFLWQTVDPQEPSGSFRGVSEERLQRFVAIMNEMDARYRKMGFDKVVFSIVPNPVSLVQPRYQVYNYNQLIPRLQKSPLLKAELVDAYTAFAAHSPRQLYYPSDTHWNMKGVELWLDLMNERLKGM